MPYPLKPLDNCYTVEIPEGALLTLHAAGIGVRAMAFMLDFCIRAVLYIVIATILNIFAKAIMGGLVLITIFVLEWFYPVIFETWQDGMTPGKRYFGIKVVNEDGTPVHFRNSLLRNLLRFVDFLPLLYLTAVISALLSDIFQRLGDRVAGTVVVYVPPALKMPKLDQSGVRRLPFIPDAEEERALIEFAERSPRLHEMRVRELATVLQPVLGTDEDPVLALKQIANTLLGRQ